MKPYIMNLIQREFILMIWNYDSTKLGKYIPVLRRPGLSLHSHIKLPSFPGRLNEGFDPI